MTRTSLPARYDPPSTLAETRWVLSWSVVEQDMPLSPEEITALQLRVETELLAPAGAKAAAVALERIAPGKRQRGDDWQAVARNYLEVLSELPADLLALAVARTLREWCSPELPPPGFVRTRVVSEIAERELVAMKLRTMRIKLDKDHEQREQWTRLTAEERRQQEERERQARELAERARQKHAADDPKRAVEELSKERQEFERKMAEAFSEGDAARERADGGSAVDKAALRASAERLGIARKEEPVVAGAVEDLPG